MPSHQERVRKNNEAIAIAPSREPALAELFEAAHQHIADLSAGRKQWRMCVPVQPDDSDMLLSRALEAADARLQQLHQELDQAEKEAHKWLIDYGMLAKSKQAAVDRAEAAEAEQDKLRQRLAFWRAQAVLLCCDAFNQRKV